jgi:hypothetical protein
MIGTIKIRVLLCLIEVEITKVVYRMAMRWLRRNTGSRILECRLLILNPGWLTILLP